MIDNLFSISLLYTFPGHMIRSNCTCENDTRSETTTKQPVYTLPPWSRSTTQTPRFTTPQPTSSTRRTTTPSPITPTTANWNQELFNGDYSDEGFDCEIDPETNLCSHASLLDIVNYILFNALLYIV